MNPQTRTSVGGADSSATKFSPLPRLLSHRLRPADGRGIPRERRAAEVGRGKTLFFVIGSIGIAIILIIGSFYFSRRGEGETSGFAEMVGDKQVVTILAKGGYSPRVVLAKAGVPTLLKMETKGTYDCSASFVLPSLNIQTFLPPSGVKEFTIPPQEAGKEVRGLCSMGMYGFTIKFVENP